MLKDICCINCKAGKDNLKFEPDTVIGTTKIKNQKGIEEEKLVVLTYTFCICLSCDSKNQVGSSVYLYP